MRFLDLPRTKLHLREATKLTDIQSRFLLVIFLNSAVVDFVSNKSSTLVKAMTAEGRLLSYGGTAFHANLLNKNRILGKDCRGPQAK